MKARVTLFAALVGLTVLAGCSKRRKPQQEEKSYELGTLGSTKSVETAKENLESPELLEEASEENEETNF